MLGRGSASEPIASRKLVAGSFPILPWLAIGRIATEVQPDSQEHRFCLGRAADGLCRRYQGRQAEDRRCDRECQDGDWRLAGARVSWLPPRHPRESGDPASSSSSSSSSMCGEGQRDPRFRGDDEGLDQILSCPSQHSRQTPPPPGSPGPVTSSLSLRNCQRGARVQVWVRHRNTAMQPFTFSVVGFSSVSEPDVAPSPVLGS